MYGQNMIYRVMDIDTVRYVAVDVILPRTAEALRRRLPITVRLPRKRNCMNSENYSQSQRSFPLASTGFSASRDWIFRQSKFGSCQPRLDFSPAEVWFFASRGWIFRQPQFGFSSALAVCYKSGVSPNFLRCAANIKFRQREPFKMFARVDGRIFISSLVSIDYKIQFRHAFRGIHLSTKIIVVYL